MDRKYYTGRSRTTKWRKRRKRKATGEAVDGTSSSSSDNDCIDQAARTSNEERADYEVAVAGTEQQSVVINAALGQDVGHFNGTSCNKGIPECEASTSGLAVPFSNSGRNQVVGHFNVTSCSMSIAECGASTSGFAVLGNNSARNQDEICGGRSSQTSHISYEQSPPLSSESEHEIASNVSSDEFSSDLECFEAHFLEEEPQEEGEPGIQQPLVFPHPLLQDDENQDDPDEPGYPDDGGNGDDGDVESDESEDPEYPDDPDPDDPDNGDEGDSNDESEEDLDYEAANFVHENLNVELNLVSNLTKGEVVLLELASAVRHNKTFLNILDNFRNLNLLFGPKCFPENSSTLWNLIFLNKAGIKFHVYCGREDRQCGNYIGRRDLIGENAQCDCGYNVPTSKAKFFVTLDLRKQLKQFLCVPGMGQHLQYPRTRQKISPTGIEDIYDGQEYKRLQEDGGILSDPHNFSYTFNTDGCNPTKKGSLKIYPLYVRINELPPNMRQKFHFVAAVFIDRVDPNFQSFLKPFVRQANSLSVTGIRWSPDGINEVTSKFVPICQCADSPVRYGMLNMSHWNSDYGCTYCNHRGVQAGGNQRYSFIDLERIPPFQDRTHAGMQAGMITAQRTGRPYEGHKGTSQMMLLKNHDLRQGQAVDDLHQAHEGCADDVTDLILTLAPRVVEGMTYAELMRSIDARLLNIKTPSKISRKARPVSKRGKYNGTEWRNWLIFYSVPCLSGLVSPEYVDLIAKLSYSCYLLSQDVIQPEEVNEAERLLQQYARNFEEIFGMERIKFNLHVTACHKADCVRQLGPPWVYSTYNFESLNGKLTKFVTSPKGAVIQVVTRVLLNLSVNSAQYDERIQEEVRERLNEILNKQRLKRVQHVNGNIYLVGKSEARVPDNEEREVLRREGFLILHEFEEFESVLIQGTRYKSIAGQNPTILSNDTFIYTHQDTFCTIKKVLRFVTDNGEERCGLLVTEHDVAQVLPVARHISVLRNAEADLVHFLLLDQVRSPAIKMRIEDTVFAVSLSNCHEID